MIMLYSWPSLLLGMTGIKDNIDQKKSDAFVSQQSVLYLFNLLLVAIVSTNGIHGLGNSVHFYIYVLYESMRT